MNKKLLIINILTLTAVIVVISVGIQQKKLTNAHYIQERKQKHENNLPMELEPQLVMNPLKKSAYMNNFFKMYTEVKDLAVLNPLEFTEIDNEELEEEELNDWDDSYESHIHTEEQQPSHHSNQRGSATSTTSQQSSSEQNERIDGPKKEEPTNDYNQDTPSNDSNDRGNDKNKDKEDGETKDGDTSEDEGSQDGGSNHSDDDTENDNGIDDEESDDNHEDDDDEDVQSKG